MIRGKAMEYQQHREFVRKLCKAGSVIAEELTPEDCHRLHMAIGISGEAGELLDAVKKATIYRKPLDIANIVEECGDLLFYISGILDSIPRSYPSDTGKAIQTLPQFNERTKITEAKSKQRKNLMTISTRLFLVLAIWAMKNAKVANE
jgi:NTP pyrophosphatase (non-canonical NTP hydrolase)